MKQSEIDKLSRQELIELYEVISHKPTLAEWEASLYIARSLAGIRGLRYKKQITYATKGRDIRYRKVDLDSFLEKSLVKAV